MQTELKINQHSIKTVISSYQDGRLDTQNNSLTVDLSEEEEEEEDPDDHERYY
jgi:hypothetical protein